MSKNLSTIVSEKLEKDNFQAWKFRMTNFLMGKGVWPFINGDEQELVLGVAPTVADLKTFKEQHEKARKVMYQLSVSILVSMIVHIQDVEMHIGEVVQHQNHCTKDATQVGAHNVQRNKLSINEYSMKFKGLAYSLGSIGAPIDDVKTWSSRELEWPWETILDIHWSP